MGWQIESVLKQKQRFIQMWLTNEYTVAGLCKSFGISRTTGYSLINEYELLGEYVFNHKSRAPRQISHKTSEEFEKRIVALRQKHET